MYSAATVALQLIGNLSLLDLDKSELFAVLSSQPRSNGYLREQMPFDPQALKVPAPWVKKSVGLQLSSPTTLMISVDTIVVMQLSIPF